MKLRILVALTAAFTLGASACSKSEEAPAAPAPTAAAPADPKTEAADAAPAPAAEADTTAPAPAEPGGDPMKQALELQKRALEILKANKTDAKAAAAALEAFQKENQAAIDALKKDLEAMAAKMKDNPQAAMEVMTKYSAEIQEMTKLTMDLMQEAPDLMSAPEVAAAMAKMSPAPDGPDDGGAVTDEPGGGDAVPAAKLTDEEKKTLEATLEVQEKMVEILAANAADPAKAGDALMKYVVDNQAKLASYTALHQKLQGDQAAAMEFAQKHMPRITAIATKMSELVQKHPNLLSHEKVMGAMMKMNGGQ